MAPDPTLAYATLRQLAKMQYWATRALGFSQEECVQRVGGLVREFTDDLGVSEATEETWWRMISNELDLRSDGPASGRTDVP